ncbi:MAG: GntR family transcriptional regulator [Balneolaceae bacterium]|nr:GntR family transcriptional regulator [Balneolaceae bacterium]
MAEHIPQYQKIACKLREEIVEGYYSEGDKLPSEKRLCEYFDVSRVTVRHALQLLENEDLIHKKQGLGAFVSNIDVANKLVQLTDFSEDMRKAGFESKSKLISLEKTGPVKDVNTFLELRPDMKLIRIDRVRLANDKAVAFDRTWLPPAYGQLLFDENLTTNTLYELIEDKYEIPIIGGKYQITAATADEYIAKHLGVPVGSALLEIDRCSRTYGNKKIYFQKRYYNPDQVSYEVELSRNENTDVSSRKGLPLKEFIPKFAKYEQ